MKRALAVTILLACFALFAFWANYREVKRENERLTANQTALLQKAEYYETEAGKAAASAQKLELDYSELSANYGRMCQTADELGVKVKRLQAAATTATKTQVEVITQVRDSIVYRNGAIDTVKAIDWEDAWVNVWGDLKGRDLSLNVVSHDTITQIIHRVPKKFWFIKWGTKAIRQEVVSSNPHTKITYTEYIELKK